MYRAVYTKFIYFYFQRQRELIRQQRLQAIKEKRKSF